MPTSYSSCTGAAAPCAPPFGQIPFEYGDYLVIPRGTIYQIDFATEDNRLLYLESNDPIHTPKRYRNHFGQLLEHAPLRRTRLQVAPRSRNPRRAGRLYDQDQETGGSPRTSLRQPPLRRSGVGRL